MINLFEFIAFFVVLGPEAAAYEREIAWMTGVTPKAEWLHIARSAFSEA